MQLTAHHQVLGVAFLLAVASGAILNKTNFCTMGAVSDWINMGDTRRMRAWLLAISVAIAGVVGIEWGAGIALGNSTFPPYRTPNFAWARYLTGGLMFGVGMTLGSGCGNKTLLRVGSGSVKSLMVLVVTSIAAYAMLWSGLYDAAFNSWIAPIAVDLTQYGMKGQTLGDFAARWFGAQDAERLNSLVGTVVALALAAFVFSSRKFRASGKNVLAGSVVGLAVVGGWYLTAGPLGVAWRDFTEMATVPPSRVQIQSFTFISPMGDTVRFLGSPGNLGLINFGVMAMSGVILGATLYAVPARRFRIEWFADKADFGRHVIGAVLMGIGGVLAMGCTIGQGVTGFSTLSLGSIVAFLSIVAGAALTMKLLYWMPMRGA